MSHLTFSQQLFGFFLLSSTTALAGLGNPSDPQPAPQECGIITTIAGTGEDGFSGDGGQATKAIINHSGPIFFDGNGNLYLGGKNRIRKIDRTSGIINTVAGTGEDGFPTGDGGPATEATIKYVGSPTFDGNGNLYFADSGRIRKIDGTTGIIDALVPVYFGIKFMAFDETGNLFLVDEDNRFRTFDMTTKVFLDNVPPAGQPAIGSGYITGQVALKNSDHIYFTLMNHGQIRKLDRTTGDIIGTVAGKDSLGSFSGDGGLATEAEINYPSGVAFDGNGDFYIREKNRIRKVDRTTGIIDTIAGTGQNGFSGDGSPATTAMLDDSPYSRLAFDGNGNLYFRDNNRIRKITCLAVTEESSADVQQPRPGREQGFVHPSLPPQTRTVSPTSPSRAKAGVPPILKKAMPAERAVAKPSLLQRIKAFFSR